MTQDLSGSTVRKGMLLSMWRITTRRGSTALAFVLATASVDARVPDPITTSNIGTSARPKAGTPSASESAATRDDADLAASLAADCSREGVRCIDGATLHLGPETRLKVLGLIPVQVGDPGDPMVLAREVHVVSGRLELGIPKNSAGKKSRPFLIRTTRGESAILEHGYGINLVSEGAVTFAVPEGRMFTAQKDVWSPLQAGRARTFTKARPAGDERALLSAPRLTQTTGLVLTDSDGSRSVAIQLSPMPRAALYQVSIVQITKDGPKPVTILTSASPNVSTPPLPPGRYKARARAMDAYGLGSGNSEPLTFRVVGMKLPPGADVRDGKVQLGYSQRVQLLGGEHLEVSYGTMSQFFPAPSTLGINRGRVTLVRLREGPNRPEATLQFEPLGGVVKVEMGPPGARWPKDRVSITIRAFDGNDAPQQDTSEVVPEVFVNINQVPVDWVRRGNVLSAEVPQPTGRGPWVVRVVVRNRIGEELGRELLEVVGG